MCDQRATVLQFWEALHPGLDLGRCPGDRMEACRVSLGGHPAVYRQNCSADLVIQTNGFWLVCPNPRLHAAYHSYGWAQHKIVNFKHCDFFSVLFVI